VPPALAVADTDALVRRALAHRPDLSSARSRRDRASAALGAAERLRFPDVVLSVQGNGQGTGQQAITPPTLTFNLALVPPLLYTYRGEIEGARAELRSEELTVARTEASVLQEVATAATGFRHARERIELSQGALLDRARRARDLVLLQYRKGAASLVEYLDAERTFIAESGSHLRNLADYWIAVFVLEEAGGATAADAAGAVGAGPPATAGAPLSAHIWVRPRARMRGGTPPIRGGPRVKGPGASGPLAARWVRGWCRARYNFQPPGSRQ
jgi:cobalt-zinc-cadmium efflux system outer membrane protein